MRGWRPCMTMIILALSCPGSNAQQNSDKFSVEERAWIRAHPVIRLAVMPNHVPFIFQQRDGMWRGVAPDYLKLISQHSGLVFKIVMVSNRSQSLSALQSGKVDLVPLVLNVGVPMPAPGLVYSSAYLAMPAFLATRTSTLSLGDSNSLEDKTVALSVTEADLYGPVLRQGHDSIRIIASPDMRQALVVLAKGGANAALGSEAQLSAELRREFGGDLKFSIQAPALALAAYMALRDSDPLLVSILNKSLASITLPQQRMVRQDWLSMQDEEMSSAQLVSERYGREAMLGAALLVLIAGLAYQAYCKHQRALRSERRSALFLAVMSHEIRSPLYAVQAAVELLRLTRLDAQQRHFGDLAQSGANMLLRLLDDVLEVSKLEAGQLVLLLEPVDVVLLANNVAALQRLRAQEKGLTVKVMVLKAIPLLVLDEIRVSQILHNLLFNAIKFTEVGGVEIHLAVSDGLLEIVIADTGIGISAEVQPTLFEFYRQVAGSYKRSGGTGLGLVICRQLVDVMQGTIALDSAPGRGTRITISLPADLASQHGVPTVDALADDTRAVVVPEQRLCILVIEDQPINQEVLLAQIASLDCDIELARDGASALLCFQRREYDLVLMDCDLPDTNGFRLARAWRSLEAQQEQVRCPIIAISALTGDEHTQNCFDAGMDGTLSKPIRLAKLQNVIELWCGLTLVPAALADIGAPPLSMLLVREAMAADVANLLQSMALCESENAIRAAHRLYGASLTLGWAEVAPAVGELEQLLRHNVPTGDERCVLALQATLQACKKYQ